MLIFGTAALWVGLTALVGVVLYQSDESGNVTLRPSDDVRLWPKLDGDTQGLVALLYPFMSTPEEHPPISMDPVQVSLSASDTPQVFQPYERRTPSLPPPTPEVLLTEARLLPSEDVAIYYEHKASGELNVTWYTKGRGKFEGRSWMWVISTSVLMTAGVCVWVLFKHLKQRKTKLFDHNTDSQLVNPKDYEIESVIGAGEFSKVYLAKDRRKGDTCCIKVIRLNEMSSKVYDVFSELAILQLGQRSAYILSLRGYWQIENQVHVVADYAQGSTLEHLIQKETYLPECYTRLITAQIVEGLIFLHKHDIIHRDLEPANVVVSAKLQVTILDFSSAIITAVCNDGQKPHLCRSKVLYMAPEIVFGEAYNGCADYWSLGVILYWYVFQCFPYQASTIRELAIALKSTQPDFPSHFLHSRALRDFIRRLLTIDVTNRLGHPDCQEGPIKKHCFMWGVDWCRIESGQVEMPMSRFSTESRLTTTENRPPTTPRATDATKPRVTFAASTSVYEGSDLPSKVNGECSSNGTADHTSSLTDDLGQFKSAHEFLNVSDTKEQIGDMSNKSKCHSSAQAINKNSSAAGIALGLRSTKDKGVHRCDTTVSDTGCMPAADVMQRSENKINNVTAMSEQVLLSEQLRLSKAVDHYSHILQDRGNKDEDNYDSVVRDDPEKGIHHIGDYTVLYTTSHSYESNNKHFIDKDSTSCEYSLDSSDCSSKSISEQGDAKFEDLPVDNIALERFRKRNNFADSLLKDIGISNLPGKRTVDASIQEQVAEVMRRINEDRKTGLTNDARDVRKGRLERPTADGRAVPIDREIYVHGMHPADKSDVDGTNVDVIHESVQKITDMKMRYLDRRADILYTKTSSTYESSNSSQIDKYNISSTFDNSADQPPFAKRRPDGIHNPSMYNPTLCGTNKFKDDEKGLPITDSDINKNSDTWRSVMTIADKLLGRFPGNKQKSSLCEHLKRELMKEHSAALARNETIANETGIVNELDTPAPRDLNPTSTKRTSLPAISSRSSSSLGVLKSQSMVDSLYHLCSPGSPFTPDQPSEESRILTSSGTCSELLRLCTTSESSDIYNSVGTVSDSNDSSHVTPEHLRPPPSSAQADTNNPVQPASNRMPTILQPVSARMPKHDVQSNIWFHRTPSLDFKPRDAVRPRSPLMKPSLIKELLEHSSDTSDDVKALSEVDVADAHNRNFKPRDKYKVQSPATTTSSEGSSSNRRERLIQLRRKRDLSKTTSKDRQTGFVKMDNGILDRSPVRRSAISTEASGPTTAVDPIDKYTRYVSPKRTRDVVTSPKRALNRVDTSPRRVSVPRRALRDVTSSPPRPSPQRANAPPDPGTPSSLAFARQARDAMKTRGRTGLELKTAKTNPPVDSDAEEKIQSTEVTATGPKRRYGESQLSNRVSARTERSPARRVVTIGGTNVIRPHNDTSPRRRNKDLRQRQTDASCDQYQTSGDQRDAFHTYGDQSGSARREHISTKKPGEQQNSKKDGDQRRPANNADDQSKLTVRSNPPTTRGVERIVPVKGTDTTKGDGADSKSGDYEHRDTSRPAVIGGRRRNASPPSSDSSGMSATPLKKHVR